MTRTKILLLLTFLCFCTVQAQVETDFSLRRLTTNDGMSNNYVRNAAQDSKGFIWFATLNGLSRYDGYHFVNYRHSNTTNDSLLVENRLLTVLYNPNGLLWVQQRGQLISCFDTRRNMFLDFSTTGNYKERYKNIHICHNGDTWLWEPGGVCRIVSLNGNTITSHRFNVHTHCLLDGGRFGVFVSTPTGLRRYMKGTLRPSIFKEVVEQYCTMKDGIWFTNHSGRLYHITSSGRVVVDADLHRTDITGLVAYGRTIFVLTSGATYEYDIATRQMHASRLLPAIGGRLHIGRRGNVFVEDNTGCLYFVDATHSRIFRWKIYDKVVTNADNTSPLDITSDNHNRIWVSAKEKGLLAFDRNTGKPIPLRQCEVTTITTAFVLADNGGNIWTGQRYLGVYKLSFMPDGIQLLKSWDAASAAQASMLSGLRRVHGDELTICYDRKGEKWVGTRGHGLYVGARHYMNDGTKGGLPSDKVNDIFCDAKGRMWLGTEAGGLCLAIPRGDGGYTFRQFTFGGKVLKVAKVISLSNGMLAVGCMDVGLLVFNADHYLKTGRGYRFYKKELGNPDNMDIRCVYEDRTHHLWVATFGSGLFRSVGTDMGNLSFESINTSDGLADNTVESILEDSRGNVWIGTDNGLSSYNMKSGRMTSHHLTINPLGDVFLENSSLLLKNRMMAFGTNDGILIFNPLNVMHGKKITTLSISDMNINGQGVNETGLRFDFTDGSTINLEHNQNSLTFFFSNFAYETFQSTEYSTWLEGKDKGWSNLSNQPSVTYQNLAPGHYVLHVRSFTGNSSTPDKEITLNIDIESPWWATWWAYLIYIVVVVSLCLYFYRMARTILSLRHRISVERQMTSFKSLFFMNISHEFRTPLTLIQGAMDQINDKGDVPAGLRQPLYSMDRSVSRMRRLIDQLMEYHRMENGQLHLRLERLDIIAFIRDIADTFRTQAQQRSVTLLFTPFASSQEGFFDRSYLDKIAYNLISNAFKYTPRGGSVTIKIGREGDMLVLSVADTGIGIPKEKQRELFHRFMQSSFAANSMGIGLNLTHQLVKVHHGDIRFEENEGGGSVFIVTLPVDENVYLPDDFLQSSDKDIKEDEREASVREYRQASPMPMNSQKVLVVEDDDDVRTFISDGLAPYFVVKTAANGQEAWDILSASETGTFSIVVSDIRMPQMNGLTLLRKIRGEKSMEDIPVIMLTAFDDENKQLKGIIEGADDYIQKPFSMKVLQARCLSLVRKHEKVISQIAAAPADGKTPVMVAPPPVITSERDKKFMDTVHMLISQNMSKSDFSVDVLAEQLNMGRSKFYAKLKEMTGKTPNNYIRDYRMDSAAEMLQGGKLTVAEVAYKVGFSDPMYFSSCFKKKFGVLPSKYKKGEIGQKTE